MSLASPTAVVLGAAPFEVGPRLRARLARLADVVVVAADRGAVTALELGLTPAVVLGDLDSIQPVALAAVRARGIAVEAFPRDKDVTDGELAVLHALDMVPSGSEVLLLGFLGGPRLDHELANVLLLARLPPGCVLVDELTEVCLLRGGQRFGWSADPNELVTLLAIGGPAHGVSTRGLRWQLDGATLELGSTRGVSNEPRGELPSVELGRGLLLVVRHFGAG